MFITNNLVYIQLQKTACSHIAKLLAELIGGEQRGRHNAAPKDLLNGQRIIVSSIRDPWEWYLSLWNYGCDGRGGFRERVTKERDFKKPNIKSPMDFLIKGFRELSRKPEQWENTYHNCNYPEQFQKWLFMIHDPKIKNDIGEKYGKFTICRDIGFYTYRYLKLCCTKTDLLYQGILNSVEDAKSFEKDYCYIDKWIRTESLEKNLIGIINFAEKALSCEEKEFIYTFGRTNASSRIKKTEYYYNNETVELVKSREILIIEKFGYTPPSV